MNQIIKVGKWFFIISFFIFGMLHFVPLEFSLPYVPGWLPFPIFWVYFVGICFLLFVLSASIRRYDRLASTLLGFCLLLFVLLVHIPGVAGGNFSSIIGATRDLAMCGAAWMYASAFAKDSRVIG